MHQRKYANENKHRKSCSELEKCKLKPWWDTNTYLSELQKKKTGHTKGWQGCGGMALTHCWGWGVKWYDHFEKQIGSFLKCWTFICHMILAILLTGIHLRVKEIPAHSKTWIGIFIVILFVTFPKPQVHQQMSKWNNL